MAGFLIIFYQPYHHSIDTASELHNTTPEHTHYNKQSFVCLDCNGSFLDLLFQISHLHCSWGVCYETPILWWIEKKQKSGLSLLKKWVHNTFNQRYCSQRKSKHSGQNRITHSIAFLQELQETINVYGQLCFLVFGNNKT